MLKTNKLTAKPRRITKINRQPQVTVLADRGLQDVRPHEGDPRRGRLVVVPLVQPVDRQDITPTRSLCRLLLFFARMLFVPVAFLDLLRSAFLGFSL